MTVLITGGAGFLGRRLARALDARGVLMDAEGRPEPISRIVLLDVVPAERLESPRMVSLCGDIADPDVLHGVVGPDTTSIFHLAAVVSGQAEADLDLGLRINLDASRGLLDVCRHRGHRPRVVFTSSVAVFGGDLPPVVEETTALTPQSSYGAAKAMAELLLGDYTRRNFVDGRVLRLPTVCVRPGRPNAAASSFASGIIREPLAGEDAICPVSPDTRLWLLSPDRAVDALIHGHEIESAALGTRRAVNLSGLSVTVKEMVAALDRVAGAAVASRIRWQADSRIQRIVGSWPGAFDTTRATALGFRGDGRMDDVIRAHMRDT